jgi:hypothetical protein
VRREVFPQPAVVLANGMLRQRRPHWLPLMNDMISERWIRLVTDAVGKTQLAGLKAVFS